MPSPEEIVSLSALAVTLVIAKPVRSAVATTAGRLRLIGPWIRDLQGCAACTGFWIGVAYQGDQLSDVTNLAATTLPTLANAALVAYVAWVLHSVGRFLETKATCKNVEEVYPHGNGRPIVEGEPSGEPLRGVASRDALHVKEVD